MDNNTIQKTENDNIILPEIELSTLWALITSRVIVYSLITSSRLIDIYSQNGQVDYFYQAPLKIDTLYIPKKAV